MRTTEFWTILPYCRFTMFCLLLSSWYWLAYSSDRDTRPGAISTDRTGVVQPWMLATTIIIDLQKHPSLCRRTANHYRAAAIALSVSLNLPKLSTDQSNLLALNYPRYTIRWTGWIGHCNHFDRNSMEEIMLEYARWWSGSSQAL